MELPEKTRADLGWDALIAHLEKRTRSARGALLARELELFGDAGAAQARVAEVGEARALRDQGEPLPLDGIRDLGEAVARAAKGGALEPQLLRDVASTLATGARTRQHLVGFGKQAPRLLGRAALIADLDDVSGPIDDAFEPGEGTRLSDRASPALGGLRKRAAQVRDELERRISSLLDASHVQPHLQDRFATQREDRFVIPVRVDARAKVRGIVHGTSQSGQTVFVEPEEIVDLNNRLKLAELEVAEEERRILVELSHLVEEALPRIRVNLEVLAVLDLIDACARLALDLRATPPEIGDGTVGIDLRRARHPLIVLAGRECVPNDILVAFGQTMVISGPNAGGKTVALKTAGLCALMARAGLPIPAQEGSKVPFFAGVLTDVGDDQSLERNLSTFSAHVMHLREFVASARAGLLVLLDEVAVGTDPEQGAALAQAVLEALAARGATAIVTTHYDRLKALPARDPRFVNASVGFDVDTLQPTYQLHLGVPGASGAIVVARRLGLDEAICARASALSREKQGSLDELLLDVARERRRVDSERAQAAEERDRVTQALRDAEAKEQKARAALEHARKGAHDEAVAKLREARAELDRTRAVLRRSGGKITPAEVGAAKQEIEAAAKKLVEAAPAPPPPPGRSAQPEELKPGVEVWVARLGGKAQVLAAPRGGKLSVQAGVLKATVQVAEVRMVDGKRPEPAAQPSQRARRGHNAFDEAPPPMPKARGSFPQLDLRGERVDAAIALAEKFLDDALRAGADGVLVIHGHGTGALRDRLREHLRLFPGVSGIRPGTPDEGGDGVTVALLE
jgi:DNA mismatch repair protein MutS2